MPPAEAGGITCGSKVAQVHVIPHESLGFYIVARASQDLDGYFFIKMFLHPSNCVTPAVDILREGLRATALSPSWRDRSARCPVGRARRMGCGAAHCHRRRKQGARLTP